MHIKAAKRVKASRGNGRKLPEDNSLPLVLADYTAAYQLLDSGALDAYAGSYVAVVNGAVAGSGPDSAALRQQVSRERQLHPERMAIVHVFDEATIPR